MSKSIKTNLSKVIISDNLEEFKIMSKLLVNLNDVINEKSLDNSLHLCSIFNSIKIMKYLLEDCVQQIDVNIRNREEKTALHLSSQYKHLICTQLLLNNSKIRIDSLNRSDWSPLMLALTKDNNLDVIKLLVRNKADLSLKNKDGWNGFHIAVRTGCLPQIQYLFECDPTVCDTKSKINRSPLHTAALCGHYSVVEFLLDNCHYKCDERDSCGITPFMESLRSNCTEMSQLFIEKQFINPLLSDVLGRNAFHISCEANSIDSIKYLIYKLNFDINCVTTKDSLSGLHLATKEGHIQTIQLLLDFGADISLTDKKGRTSYDLAVALKRYDCQQLLR